MKSKKPKISVITCTYNAGNFIKSLLASVLYQSEKDIEIIFCDGGSTDETLEIIKSYSSLDKRIKLIHNKNKLPEGFGYGKSQAFNQANAPIVLFIDQDNILQSPNVFKTALEIFRKDKNTLGVLAGLKNDKSDSLVVRYVSLVGTDSFFAYRSIDFLRNLGKVNSQEIITSRINNQDIESVSLSNDHMPLTGGNCFFYRSNSLRKIGGYSQDVLVVKKLLNKRLNKLHIIKNATKHYAESSLYSLIKKKFFWASKFKTQNKERFDYLPKTSLERFTFFRNFLFCLLIFPNFIYSFKISLKSKDLVIFFYPIMAFLNTLAYLTNYIKSKFN